MQRMCQIFIRDVIETFLKDAYKEIVQRLFKSGKHLFFEVHIGKSAKHRTNLSAQYRSVGIKSLIE